MAVFYKFRILVVGGLDRSLFRISRLKTCIRKKGNSRHCTQSSWCFPYLWLQHMISWPITWHFCAVIFGPRAVIFFPLSANASKPKPRKRIMMGSFMMFDDSGMLGMMRAAGAMMVKRWKEEEGARNRE
jgi:hypothetical protein